MHTILSADFVTTEDGTGIVHQSPAFGEEDKELTDSYGILAVRPVDDAGLFDSTVPDYEGQQVFDANRQIIRDLRDHTGPLAGRNALLVRHESYEHSYPHCWRAAIRSSTGPCPPGSSASPSSRTAWSNSTSRSTGCPENVKYGQFGKWLENARDWSISRNRFWGSPIPVWISNDPSYPRTDVYGSLAEIEADFGRLPVNDRGEVDLHRPWVDDLTRPNPDDPTGKSTMRRIPEIFDVWFDSGSMSYAQVHYPFENAEWFDNHFPADFIVEYIGQTRGWFYLLHVLATAIFDRPAFRNVISHGIVLGSDGQKMSKSLRNYPDVNEVFDRDGSDAMRWFLMASSILRGGNLVVTEQGIRDAVRQVVLPLWNTWQFFATYSNTADAAGGDAGEERAATARRSASTPPRSSTATCSRRPMTSSSTSAAAMDDFDVWAACEIVRGYLDMLTNWYVRRSRRRFWDGGAETHETFDVLYTCLEAFCRVAPRAAVHGRGDLPRTHRQPLRPPRGLPGCLRVPGRRRPRRRDGSHPRHQFDRLVGAQGQPPAGAPAAQPPRRRQRRASGVRVHRDHRRRAQRQGGRIARPRRGGGKEASRSPRTSSSTPVPRDRVWASRSRPRSRARRPGTGRSAPTAP